MSLHKEPAYKLAKMIRTKQCSVSEIVSDVFSQIEKTNDVIKSYISLNKEAAINKAKEIDTKISNSEDIPLLSGIPIGIKDNIMVKDMPCTCASKMLENFVSPYDATVVKKLKENDMIITGKLNMDEFAMGSSNETSFFGKVKNPINTDHVPGGSSGGSAASVSAFQTPVSLGTDTGGSIRQPAAFCGVIGLKPTYSSVSRYGLVSFASSLDQIGTLTRNTKDMAMLYSAICGYDKYDSTTVDRKYNNFYDNLNPKIKGKVIGIPQEYFNEDIDPEVEKSIYDSIKTFEKCGAKIKKISLPNTKYSVPVYYSISSAEASSNLARFDGIRYGHRSNKYKNLEEMYINSRSEGFGREVIARIMIGAFVLSSSCEKQYYKRAVIMQQKIKQEFEDSFKECDIIITPTTQTTAFKVGKSSKQSANMYKADIYTSNVNIAGLPAISIPCGEDSKGMPIGMQIIAPHFGEQTLFDVCSFFEDNIYKYETNINLIKE